LGFVATWFPATVKEYGEQLHRTVKQDCMLSPSQRDIIKLIGAYHLSSKKIARQIARTRMMAVGHVFAWLYQPT
jgi:DNA-binding CsgD family transcriptional regulator